MTTALLPPRGPVLMLTLDTQGPLLTISAPGVAQPPDVVAAEVTSNEQMCEASAFFLDSVGQTHPLGVVVDDLTISLLLPTVGMPSGRGTLRVLARDCACNIGSAEWPIYIDRPRPFDLQPSTTGQFDMTSGHDHAMEIESTTGGVFETEPGIDGAFEIDTVSFHSLDLEPEAHNGG